MIAGAFLVCALALPPEKKEEEFQQLAAYLAKVDPEHEYVFMDTKESPTPRRGWRQVNVQWEGLFVWRKKIREAV